MPGIQLPIGIETVNPVDADYKRGPWPTIAAALAGINIALRYNNLSFYVVGDPNEYYWLDTDLSDAGLLIRSSSGGSSLPIVRYVYLVQDASDEILMGGITSNVYTTYQDAYNAANTLQISLGGVNRVNIIVGNITAAAAGTCSVSTWNSNVYLIGTHRLLSNLGVTNIATIGLTVMQIANISIGSVFSEGGISITMENSRVTAVINTSSTTGNAGPITIAGFNSSINSINTSSTAGNSGNATFNFINNMSIGTITQTTSLGNVGGLTITSVNNSTFNSITRTATDPVGNRSIGVWSMSNSSNNTFSTINTFITNPLSTGTIEIFIGRTNQNNTFNGVFTIQGCPTSSRSDVGLDLQFINCTFNQPLLVNSAGTFISERGGWIKRLDIQNSQFLSRARFVNWPINPQTTDPILFDLTVNIKDCTFSPLTSGSAGLFFQNNDVSYTTYLIKDVESSDILVGISLGVNVSSPPVINWMIDSSYIDYQNVRSNISLQTYDPLLNPAAYNAIVSSCNGGFLYLAAYEDFNFQVNMCNYDYVGYEWGHGTVPLTRPWYINNSRMGAVNANPTFNWGGIGPLNFVIKNSYFAFWTDILNPQAISLLTVYNSFIESISDVGSTTTYTGTLFTSTIRRLVTEIVAGLTFNNSYDDSY